MFLNIKQGGWQPQFCRDEEARKHKKKKKKKVKQRFKASSHCVWKWAVPNVSHVLCALWPWLWNEIKHHMKPLLLETLGKSGLASISHPAMLPQGNSWKSLDHRLITGGSKLTGPSDVTSTVCGDRSDSSVHSSAISIPLCPYSISSEKSSKYVMWSTWDKLCQKYESLM